MCSASGSRRDRAGEHDQGEDVVEVGVGDDVASTSLAQPELVSKGRKTHVR